MVPGPAVSDTSAHTSREAPEQPQSACPDSRECHPIRTIAANALQLASVFGLACLAGLFAGNSDNDSAVMAAITPAILTIASTAAAAWFIVDTRNPRLPPRLMPPALGIAIASGVYVGSYLGAQYVHEERAYQLQILQYHKEKYLVACALSQARFNASIRRQQIEPLTIADICPPGEFPAPYDLPVISIDPDPSAPPPITAIASDTLPLRPIPVHTAP